MSLENQTIFEIIFGEKSEVVQDKSLAESVTSSKKETSNFSVDQAAEESKDAAPPEYYIIEELTAETQESFDEPQAMEPLDSNQPSRSKTKRKYTRFDCYVCSEQFSTNLKFTQHFSDSHPKSEIRYNCFMCPNFVLKYRSYTRHLESHDEKRFSCDICDKFFSQKITLVQHINSHSSLKLYKCPECDLNFKQNASLFKHRKQKHSKNVPTCPECHKPFVNKETLTQHMRSKHSLTKIIKCAVCEKSFASRSALLYHRSSQHQDNDEDIKTLARQRKNLNKQNR